MFGKLYSTQNKRQFACQEVIVKSLSIFALLSILVLTGCAYPSYQRGYAGYSSGYSTGYGVHSYSSYPESVYYRQSMVPSYSYGNSAPRYGHDHGVQHYDRDWGHNRHERNRPSQDRPWVERNVTGMHHSGVAEWQTPRTHGDHDGLRQRMQQPKNDQLRMEGRSDRSSWHGGRQEGGFGRQHGHHEGR